MFTVPGPLIVKLGAWILSVMVLVTVRLPEVPVRVNTYVPAVTELLAMKVRTLLAEVGFVPKDAVTPLGSPAMLRFTLPVKPYRGATVMVEVADAP